MKQGLQGFVNGDLAVAPFTGAWIETMSQIKLLERIISRTLHGCVD